MALALTCRVRSDDPALRETVAATAYAAGRPSRALHLQALLQLPRLADERGGVPLDEATELVVELADGLPPEPAWRVAGPHQVLSALRFHHVDDAVAADVLSRFHYLRSARHGGRAYGLSTPAGDLVALCVSSPLDVGHLKALLVGQGREHGTARVVSRVFAFEGAPHNTLSFLLAKACRSEERIGVTDVVTYVNPNMGFLGSSYRASGWHLLDEEPGTRYRYIDGRYTTDRALAAAFGSHDDSAHGRLLGHRYAVSIMPLAPLLVFHRRLA